MRALTKLTFIVSAVLVLFSSATPSFAERRVAFVVGNGAYKFATLLPNPAADAASMAVLLRNVGFDVVEGVDLTRDAMTSRLREFAQKSANADVALFFYAGHGIAVNGKNYLIPIDADLKSELDVKLGAAVEIDSTLDQTMSEAKLKLVLLDACRDNPFAGKIRSASPRTRNVVVSTGLAEMKSGEGTLIAFATAPGQTALDGEKGGNSPFTRALLANLAEPGVEVRHALTKARAQVSEETSKQQIPWENTNLTGFFYMNPAANGATQVAALTAPANISGQVHTLAPRSTVSMQEIDLEFWRSVKDSTNPAEVQAYINRFPNGNFVGVARARIAALNAETEGKSVQDAMTGTEKTENSLQLDVAEVRELQRRLGSLGFYQGANDGRFGPNTRRAIERWQAARNYPKSGYFNKPQYDALSSENIPVARQLEPAPQREIARPRPAAPHHAPAHRGGFDPGAAAFMGGMLGGALGGMIRR